MIPPLDPSTGYLPQGIYDATIADISAIFGNRLGRVRLLDGLRVVSGQLFAAHVDELYIAGSFCTANPVPKDIDGFWVYHPGVDVSKIDTLILQPNNFVIDPQSGYRVMAMTLKFGVEFFIQVHPHDTMNGEPFKAFYSHSRDGVPRGIIRVRP